MVVAGRTLPITCSMPSHSATSKRRQRVSTANIACLFLASLAIRRGVVVAFVRSPPSSSAPRQAGPGAAFVSAFVARPTLTPTPISLRSSPAGRRSPLHAYTTTGFREPADNEERQTSEIAGREADVDRWERMWEEGQLKRNVQVALDLSSPDARPLGPAVTKSEVRVVSFDLDNTLWKTGEVISHANDVLSQYLSDKGVNVPVRTEIVMGELFKKNPARYCPKADFVDDETKQDTTSNNNDDKASTDFDKAAGGEASRGVHISSGASKPVLLTQLRIDALRDILVRYNAYADEDARAAAEEAFQIWTTARHDAIPNHFAEQVVESLEMLRTIESRDGHRVVIGGITDGNSDPRNVEALRPYFDFVVNSEQVGVSKPDARVYLKAAEQLLENPRLEDVFIEAMGACKMLDDAVEKADLLESAIGPWWVHIGDDFMKDIVAARELGMRTIWSRELVRTSPASAEEKESATRQLNEGEAIDCKQKKERCVADLVKELATMKVVEMSIGADEFLADSIHREFADEIVDNFARIVDLLHEWHLDGSSDDNDDVFMARSTVFSDSLSENLMSDAGVGPETRSSVPTTRSRSTDSSTLRFDDEPAKVVATSSRSSEGRNKFCVFCGTELPYEARFCSSCGEKQPPEI